MSRQVARPQPSRQPQPPTLNAPILSVWPTNTQCLLWIPSRPPAITMSLLVFFFFLLYLLEEHACKLFKGAIPPSWRDPVGSWFLFNDWDA